MASEFRLHRPYVLATLPRPLDHTDGNTVAREVYGQRGGQRKKKRTELAVGIDGENASIYDVPTSRLITSYPIPPQESFTCPPYSIRIRPTTGKEIFRYTYIATKANRSQKVTLFKDVVHEDGKTTSTTISQNLASTAIRYITTPSNERESSIGDVIVVCEDGEVFSMSGERLAVQWSASSKAAVQDAVPDAITDFKVDYVTSGSVSEFSDGIFKRRTEVFAALPKSTESDPEVLSLVATSTSKEQETCHLITLATLSGSSSANSELQKSIVLDIAPLSFQAESAAVYEVDIQSGNLMQLSNGTFTVYDLTTTVPKVKTSFDVEDSTSIVRLSRPFILTGSIESIGLYNYQYRSIHAKSPLDLSELPNEFQSPKSIKLISFLRSQDLVVMLIDNVLVSIHVEPPKHHGKRRKEGLLIDSIGRGTMAEIPAKRTKTEHSVEFSRQVPGTMTESYIQELRIELQLADELLSNSNVGGWEDLLRKKFHMRLAKPLATEGEETADTTDLPEWKWLQNSSHYPVVDRRWVMYAIGQVFSVQMTESGDPRPELKLVLPESNVATYLVVAGHLTLSNVKSAFVEEWGTADDKILALDLVQSTVDADPSMSLLLNYLQATKLGEVEILLAIRALMRSMDFLPDARKLSSTKLLKAEPEATDKYEMDLDDLERELAVTEQYLGDDASSRSRGLTLAFTKLWRIPAINTVKALRVVIRTEEILSFIYLLRMELVRGAWTTLYIDPTTFDAEGNDSPPDGVITLIADLLARCIDAIGAGGWLFNDAMSWSDKEEAGDFLTALRLEVTAALEGIEEAVQLNGIISEAVRFSQAVIQSGQVSRQLPQDRTLDKPISLQVENKESRMLPLGLKAKELVSKEKVVSGGEVIQRSVRETGHLISQKVEAYSLERLAI